MMRSSFVSPGAMISIDWSFLPSNFAAAMARATWPPDALSASSPSGASAGPSPASSKRVPDCGSEGAANLAFMRGILSFKLGISRGTAP
jgi:hypothetical protein